MGWASRGAARGGGIVIIERAEGDYLDLTTQPMPRQSVGRAEDIGKGAEKIRKEE